MDALRDERVGEMDALREKHTLLSEGYGLFCGVPDDLRVLLGREVKRVDALFSAPFSQEEAEWLMCDCKEVDTIMIFSHTEKESLSESYGLQDWRDSCVRARTEACSAEEDASEEFEPSIPGLSEVVILNKGKILQTGYACCCDREDLIIAITGGLYALFTLDVHSFYLLSRRRFSSEYASDDLRHIARDTTVRFLDHVVRRYQSEARALELYLSVSARILKLVCTTERYKDDAQMNEALTGVLERNCVTYITAIKQHLLQL